MKIVRTLRLLSVAFSCVGTGLFAQHGPTQYPYSYYQTSPQTVNGEVAQVTFTDGALVDLDTPPDFDTGTEAETVSSATVAGETASANATGGLVGAEIGNGSFRVNGVKGDITTVRVPYSRKLNERTTLQLTIPLSVTNFDQVLAGAGGFKDAQAYGAGLNAGLAWQRFLKKDQVPYRWKITPSAGLFYRDSTDLKVGSMVFNLGLSSSFAYQFKPGWVVNVGNSFSTAWNNGIRNYPDPIRDDQQTLANGLQLLHLAGRWTYHVYLSHTHQLNENILVDNYWTLGAGAAFKLTKTRSLRATLVTENGNADYRSNRATLGTTWSF